METCRMVMDNLHSSKSQTTSETETGDNLLVVGRLVHLTKVSSNQSEVEVPTNTMKEIHESLSQMDKPLNSDQVEEESCVSTKFDDSEQRSLTYACISNPATDSSIDIIQNSEVNTDQPKEVQVPEKKVPVHKRKRVKVKRTPKKPKVRILPTPRRHKKKSKSINTNPTDSKLVKAESRNITPKKRTRSIEEISDKLMT
uniref:Uncharacterized protein n=1 Tax=Ciona savignyi TaxID=51511 RepID=H2YZY3_CIOSA